MTTEGYASGGNPDQAGTPQKRKLYAQVADLVEKVDQLLRISDDRTHLIGQLINRIEILEGEVGLL